MVQGHVGISPWEFESPLRHHGKKGHRKVAFLLEKIRLGLLRMGGWVRIGCVWVHLVKLIHIVTGVLWKPVIKGKDVAWRLHMLFIWQKLQKLTSWQAM